MLGAVIKSVAERGGGSAVARRCVCAPQGHLLNPRDGRRGATDSMRMPSAAPMARREASAPSSRMSS